MVLDVVRLVECIWNSSKIKNYLVESLKRFSIMLKTLNEIRPTWSIKARSVKSSPRVSYYKRLSQFGLLDHYVWILFFLANHNSDLKELPLRYELEVPTHSEESDTNVLKNPPPSPVCQHPSSSTSPFSLSGHFSPDLTSLSRDSFDSSSYPRSPDQVLN